MAKKYLCALVTSVPSEGAFSYGGHIINQKRLCHLPESVKMLLFLFNVFALALFHFVPDIFEISMIVLVIENSTVFVATNIH